MSTTEDRTVIDVHSHGTLDLGDGKDAGTNIPSSFVPPWSVDGALAIMDEVGITASVLSMPESGTHFDDAQNISRARQVNEFLAGIAAEHPTRFGAMACLPATTVDGALEELSYALDTLGMDAVSLPTSVRDVYLGDASFDPLFEEMDRRGVTLFVHPVQAKASVAVNLGILQSMLEFPFDTTRMITNMIFSGAWRRFSRIRMIASHGGGTFPYLLTRLQTLEPITGPGPGREKLTAEEIHEGAAWFHYDLTAATSRAHLTALTEIVEPSHLLTGFDIPFMPVATMVPAIEAIQGWSGFDEQGMAQVLHTNAASLFPSVEARRLRVPEPQA